MSPNRRVVITGVGVLAPNGIGKDEFWRNSRKGVSGIKPVTLFDTSKTKSKLAGEITEFDAEKILGAKGLRTLDRATKLVNAASKLALDDANLKYPSPELEEAGVVIGTTLGSVWSISEFDKEALREGPRYVNPANFPNTVINSPASQISIRFVIKGFNTTMSTGFAASLDALSYAVNFIKLERANIVLAGAVEEMCIQTFLGFFKIGFLAGSKDGLPEISCPFDKRRNGIIFSEASVVFILEELEYARRRKAHIYAEILGYGTSFDTRRRNAYNPRAAGATEAIRLALEDAAVSADDIDYISACANSTVIGDFMETRAIKNIFGGRAKDIPVSAIKSMVGESFSAGGALQLASSLGVLQDGVIQPTLNYEVPDKRCDLNYVSKPEKHKARRILINAFGPTGCNSSVVIGSMN